MRGFRIGERSNDVDNRRRGTMAAFPVPEHIKLVIALSQLDPLESIRHCASMRNSPRVVREGRCRLFPENLRWDSVDCFAILSKFVMYEM